MLGQLSNDVCLLFSDSLLFDQFLFDFGPWLLVKFINRTANCCKIFNPAASFLNHTFQNLSVINFHQEIFDINGFQDFLHDTENFRIRDHWIVAACNIKVTLIKLSVSTFCHDWLISSVDFSNVESLDFRNVCVHGHESCKWDCQVVSEGAFLSALVLKVINKFRVFTIFSSQDILEFENGSVNFYTTVFLENFDDRIDDFSSDGHLVGVVISGTFGALDFKFMRFLSFDFFT